MIRAGNLWYLCSLIWVLISFLSIVISWPHYLNKGYSFDELLWMLWGLPLPAFVMLVLGKFFGNPKRYVSLVLTLCVNVLFPLMVFLSLPTLIIFHIYSDGSVGVFLVIAVAIIYGYFIQSRLKAGFGTNANMAEKVYSSIIVRDVEAFVSLSGISKIFHGQKKKCADKKYPVYRATDFASISFICFVVQRQIAEVGGGMLFMVLISAMTTPLSINIIIYLYRIIVVIIIPIQRFEAKHSMSVGYES